MCSGISCPQSVPSLLAVLPPPANMYGTYNQVKFLKLPTPLPSRSDRHTVFSTGVIIRTAFVPSLVPQDPAAPTEALTKCTQQA